MATGISHSSNIRPSFFGHLVQMLPPQGYGKVPPRRLRISFQPDNESLAHFYLELCIFFNSERPNFREKNCHIQVQVYHIQGVIATAVLLFA